MNVCSGVPVMPEQGTLSRLRRMLKYGARQRNGLTAQRNGLARQRSAIIFYSIAFFLVKCLVVSQKLSNFGVVIN